MIIEETIHFNDHPLMVVTLGYPKKPIEGVVYVHGVSRDARKCINGVMTDWDWKNNTPLSLS